jgi:hypothetical protein
MARRPSDGDLKRIFKKNLPQFDFQPVEMGVLASGVPDLNYCYRGVEGWIELKATKAYRVRVEKGQVAWISRRVRRGGRVVVAVRRADDELWLIGGDGIQILAEGGLEGLPEEYILGQWYGGPGLWAWTEIANVLTGR